MQFQNLKRKLKSEQKRNHLLKVHIKIVEENYKRLFNKNQINFSIKKTM